MKIYVVIHAYRFTELTRKDIVALRLSGSEIIALKDFSMLPSLLNNNGELVIPENISASRLNF